ncbi:hypothetical protein ABT112_25145, partial [Streptomyces sp. NPDC002055]
MTYEQDKPTTGPGPLSSAREPPGPVHPDKRSADAGQPAGNGALPPGPDMGVEQPGPDTGVEQHKPPRRPWSTRRITASLAAAAVLGAAGFLLFDVVWARTGHSAIGGRGL